jgi:uncharacterized phage protein gp47/JayE
VIFTEMCEAAKSRLGTELNTQSDALFGVVLAIVADRLGEAWQLGQAVHAASDPEQATGDAMKSLASLTGTAPRGATKSTVTLSCTGTPGTVLGAGRLTSVLGATSSRFVTLTSATIAAAKGWAPTTAYVLGDIRANDSRIYRCSTAGTSAASGGPTGTGTDITDNGAHWRYLGAGTGYVTVSAEAEGTGATVANAYALTTIVTPVAGWSNVTNILDAVIGAEDESSADLRTRREVELGAQGSSTVESIRGKLSRVKGIGEVVVFENTTDYTDAAGRPPHSDHVVCKQGLAIAANIAQAIFDAAGGGIETYGTQSLVVTDSHGNNHTMRWDYADVVSIYIQINVSAIETEFPADGADRIVNAMIAYGDTLPIGRDVIAEKTRGLAWAIPGVYDITGFRLDIVNPPVGTGNITIAPHRVADFDTSRVTVNVAFVTPS